MIRRIVVVGIAAMLATQPLLAQNDRDSELAELRAQVRMLSARLDQLERREATAEAPAQIAAAAPPAASATASTDRVRLSGDLRYRHETINDDASVERNRQRIRVRMGLAADVTDDVALGITLSSGGDDPISGNQTLDEGMSRKSIGIDRAFFSWDLSDEVELRGGKMGNPLFRPGDHPLIYDGDLNPEGLSLGYQSSAFFVNLAGFWVDERSSSSNDTVLLAAQGGYKGRLGGLAELTAGVSYYDYTDARGLEPFFDGSGAGNRLDGAGNYLSDFEEIELFAEASFDVGGQPLRVFADYVTNRAAVDFDKGYAIGLRYRRASAPGSWDIGWAYQDLEADAVVATFTDSDFAGGGTDGKGHVFRSNYVFRDRLNLGFTYFLNETGAAAGVERDYKRLQADVSFRY